ncbi:MAG: TnpA family transposase, partial [Planctomycetaceae bacterium]
AMPRMRILSSAEQAAFELPPEFQSEQRKSHFSLSRKLLAYARGLRTPPNQVGFLLSCSYFKAARRFFSPGNFYPRDIEYATRQLGLTEDDFKKEEYTKNTRLRHEHFILDFYGFKRLEATEIEMLETEISSMARTQLKPKLIFARCLDFLIQNKVQLPSARKLSDLIIIGLHNRKIELAKIIEKTLIPDTRKLLDQLFDVDGDEDTSANARYKLTLLKKFSHSMKPTKVKERTADLQLLEGLHSQLLPVHSTLGLGAAGIRYYAGKVIKSEIFQISRRSDEDRYVHIIAFIAHQYYRLQDNLVEVLLNSVKNAQNSAQREHKKQIYEQRSARNQTITTLLSRINKDVFQVFEKIDGLLHNNILSDAEKLDQIGALVTTNQQDKASDLQVDASGELVESSYYDVLEQKSLRLQNRASPILKVLDFQAEPGANELLKAINHFKSKDGAITASAPLRFLESGERKAVEESAHQKFKTSLYKAFLFSHIAVAIKSGNLNLVHSYKHRPLNDYLISKEHWASDKEELMKRANLIEFLDCKKVLHSLDKALYQQYETSNRHAKQGEDKYLKFAENGQFRVRTPALDDHTTDSLQSYLPKRQDVPLTEVLATVNQHTGFLDELEHWQQTHIRKPMRERTHLAAIMGLGCGIGTRKMGRISSQITEDELEHSVNWYLSLDNLRAANDRVVGHMEKLDLPNIYRRSQDKLHTSSDGQKFEVQVPSLNANYSFKYFGKSQGVSAYTFTDERNFLWHSMVFSAAERESAYMIDGLMRNDVVKSTIHSTDTHGYSEAIFGTTHLLGFSFAPRIKNLKKQSIYIFKSRKRKAQQGWLIRPDKYVNENVIEENWDDFLRLITTIKLKAVTASDIFRRLNSYSKQHSLYKAMKAFGQIIKSLFILRYLDEVELRQAIEMQLNKVELANRFTRAVAVGNSRAYTQAEKEDQEIGEACNRLIKNAIICWNYLYLTQKLEQMESDSEKEKLLAVINTHSVISWQHLNMLGEYDFSDEKLQDSVGILPPKPANK